MSLFDDEVNHPSHYQFRYPCDEVRDVINERVSGAIDYSPLPYGALYDYSNAIKYILRAPYKGDITKDLKKAKNCIESILNLLEAN